MRTVAYIRLLSFPILCMFAVCGKADNSLKSAQKVIEESLQANNLRMRVAAENMANSKSAGYAPKMVDLNVRKSRKDKVHHVNVKQVRSDQKKIKQIYDPGHPQADEQGMVKMPDVDPLIMMMNLNQAKIDNERAMKVYHMLTDQRLKILSMINN